MFFGAGHRARLAIGRVLGHAMGDEVDGIIARHVLFLQEIGRVRFPLGKDCDQHVGPGHLGAARRLHMDGRALDDALEGSGGNRFRPFDIGDQCREVVVDELDKRLAQLVQINRTGLHHP